ncbi:hypothetical protein B0J11DRAFT_525442 [Dendryphion nanum]|uniref:Cupin type-1 domain-containing protein n=1 Tax=Dendryphion nanum TaxID=256645 RepID=A0A9P9DZK5_9PLEO|nr:hypothetical protein B0J11DRAFT_525442 [Dendryphion nanum]
MVEIKTYTLPPTRLIPNSPNVLIHYPRLLFSEVSSTSFSPSTIYNLFASNGWTTHWIARYGPTQPSHYHSGAHECMVVISGSGATIRFGVADTLSDGEAHTHGDGHEDGGVELKAQLGDVFILPAGVAHKTFDPRPEVDEMKFYHLEEEVIGDEGRAKKYFEEVELKGEFMMMGAYPEGDRWDFMMGGEHEGRFPEVWGLRKPGKDPVLGISGEGICGLWKEGLSS